MEPLRELLILDGGLATELEAAGHDLRHPLWSAKLLLEDPEAIRAVHAAYLAAGADAITTASYQATVQGLRNMGLEEGQAGAVLAFSVELARRAVEAHHAAHPDQPKALVVGSLGPYGAFLADGSEFKGRYGLDEAELRAHHLPQWEAMCKAGPDLIAFETVPDALEAKVLAGLFAGSPGRRGWISFSCADGGHLNDGTPVGELVGLVEQTEGLLGLGINCTAPVHVAPLLRAARAAGLRKPAIVYPNSGEVFDPQRMGWRGTAGLQDFAAMAMEWRALGAQVIGGCCRTRPEHIRLLRQVLK